MGALILFYVRHGDPIYNPDSLTPLGKRQAEAVARRIAVHGIDKIFSSSSNRAYETALPLSEITKKGIVKIDFLNESQAGKYFFVYTEKNKREWIYNIPNFRETLVSDECIKLGYKWYEHPQFADYNFKEGIDFFDKNIDEFMYSLGYEHDRVKHSYKALKENNDRVAVFAHEGMGSVFLSSIFDIPYSFAAHYKMIHTGMTAIEFAHSGDEIIPRVISCANDSHLYKDVLPTQI